MDEKDEAARRRPTRFAWGPSDVEIIRPTASEWSSEAREATRAALETGSALAATNDGIALKHHDGRFALLTEPDLHDGSLRLIDRKSCVSSVFDDADALIKAGWVLD